MPQMKPLFWITIMIFTLMIIMIIIIIMYFINFSFMIDGVTALTGKFPKYSTNKSIENNYHVHFSCMNNICTLITLPKKKKWW